MRIFRITITFENIRKIITENTASNYALGKIENRDIPGKVVIGTIKTKDKNARRAYPMFITNICRTASTLLTNGSQVKRFLQEILPVLQSWTD